MPLAPGRKFGHRPGIGFSSVRVSDVGRKEFHEPFGRVGRRREEGGECSGTGYCELYAVFHGFPLPTSNV